MDLKRYLTEVLNLRMSVDEIKEGLTIPHIYKSKIQLASLRFVVLPFYELLYGSEKE